MEVAKMVGRQAAALVMVVTVVGVMAAVAKAVGAKAEAVTAVATVGVMMAGSEVAPAGVGTLVAVAKATGLLAGTEVVECMRQFGCRSRRGSRIDSLGCS